MKRFRVLTAALCAAVLLCGFTPATAYAGGGEDWEGLDPVEPAVTEEPVIVPGEGFSEDGNLVTRDLLYDKHTNKQFITVQTSGGATFYIVIDYDKPVDEDGEQYQTYFLNTVDEALEAELSSLKEPEPEPEPVAEPDAEPEPETDKGNAGMLLLVLAVAVLGGGAAFYFKVYRPKQQTATEPEEDYGEELEDYDGEEDGPPWDEDGDEEENEETEDGE